MERVQKFLASQTGLSRRTIENHISQGKITINGSIARLGAQVGQGDKVGFQGETYTVDVVEKVKPVVLAYHKPLGVVCTRHDPEDRRTVFQDLPPCPGGGQWLMVGRLDINTSGLLLFVNHGTLCHALMHPSSGLIRMYQARIFPGLTTEGIKQCVKGVSLDGVVSRFLTITEMGKQTSQNKQYTITVNTGRNRMVRRLIESQGSQVSKLKRLGYGHFVLPQALKQGHYMSLNQKQMLALVKDLKINKQSPITQIIDIIKRG